MCVCAASLYIENIYKSNLILLIAVYIYIMFSENTLKIFSNSNKNQVFFLNESMQKILKHIFTGEKQQIHPSQPNLIFF